MYTNAGVHLHAHMYKYLWACSGGTGPVGQASHRPVVTNGHFGRDFFPPNIASRSAEHAYIHIWEKFPQTTEMCMYWWARAAAAAAAAAEAWQRQDALPAPWRNKKHFSPFLRDL